MLVMIFFFFFINTKMERKKIRNKYIFQVIFTEGKEEKKEEKTGKKSGLWMQKKEKDKSDVCVCG